jgi:hypothetical protein
MNNDEPPPVDYQSSSESSHTAEASERNLGSAIDQIDQINRIAFRRILNRRQPEKGSRRTSI